MILKTCCLQSASQKPMMIATSLPRKTNQAQGSKPCWKPGMKLSRLLKTGVCEISLSHWLNPPKFSTKQELQSWWAFPLLDCGTQPKFFVQKYAVARSGWITIIKR